MATKTSPRRKTAAKSSARRSGRAMLGIAGWVAAAALAVGWLAPQGKTFLATHGHAMPDFSSLSISALWRQNSEPGVTGSIRPVAAPQRSAPITSLSATDRSTAQPDPIADEIATAARLPMPRQRALPNLEPAAPPLRVAINRPTALAPTAASVVLPTLAPRPLRSGPRHPAYITGRPTEMRAYPFSTADVLAVLPAHQSVVHLSGDGIWRRVKVDGSNAVGWVQIPDLMEAVASNAAPIPTVLQQNVGQHANRSTPSKDIGFPTPSASIPPAR